MARGFGEDGKANRVKDRYPSDVATSHLTMWLELVVSQLLREFACSVLPISPCIHSDNSQNMSPPTTLGTPCGDDSECDIGTCLDSNAQTTGLRRCCIPRNMMDCTVDSDCCNSSKFCGDGSRTDPNGSSVVPAGQCCASQPTPPSRFLEREQSLWRSRL